MKCPKCQCEMESGFLQSESSTAVISWVSKLLPMRLGFWQKDALVVSEELAFGSNAIPTHICKHCKLLLGDYSQKK